MKSIPERFWWMNWEELQIRCFAHSVATIARYFATTRSMNIKRWKDHYWKSSVQHSSEEKPPQMNRKRSVEMLVLWEFHLHHHQNSSEDEFWPQTLITGLTSFSLTTSFSLITLIRKSVNRQTIIPHHWKFEARLYHWKFEAFGWTISWIARWTTR